MRRTFLSFSRDALTWGPATPQYLHDSTSTILKFHIPSFHLTSLHPYSSLLLLHQSHLLQLLMADALLSIVLDSLGSLIQQQIHQEVSLVVGVEREIQSLTNTLQIVRAVVADAEKRQVREELVKVWL
ncbi:hypothetical protein CK203_050066 [Vitis vinifera]|uniref:Disease resistance N-terminal domain-containing protein n=1 Tax=Vitis vinifera TaxID=29760 RepID=A0A438H540_VITVI|nr:hypothetical protein CK203_050066 [Vitis vinifera]